MRLQDIVSGRRYAVRHRPGSSSLWPAELHVGADGRLATTSTLSPRRIDPADVICEWDRRSEQPRHARELAAQLAAALSDRGLAHETGRVGQDGLAALRLSPEAL